MTERARKGVSASSYFLPCYINIIFLVIYSGRYTCTVHGTAINSTIFAAFMTSFIFIQNTLVCYPSTHPFTSPLRISTLIHVFPAPQRRGEGTLGSGGGGECRGTGTRRQPEGVCRHVGRMLAWLFDDSKTRSGSQDLRTVHGVQGAERY